VNLPADPSKQAGHGAGRLIFFNQPACSSLAEIHRHTQDCDMDFSKWKSMDPHLLVGLVNTELRNHSESLEDLVKTHDLPAEDLRRKLGEAGYDYRAEQNQFR
jgi:hypothetical protein